MNGSIVRYILGMVLKLEAVFMLLPALCAAIYREESGIWFVAVAAGSFLIGLLMTLKKPTDTVFYLKEGCAATALSWIFLSLFGCLPFFLSGEIPGFTTTGSSILDDVEALPYCMLFWRSFTHWIGGMGVLVFLLAIIPMSGGSNINLMRAESPGPSVGKLVPKIRYTARILYIIYIGMTLIEIIFLLLGRMSLFEALNTAFATAGTGGFGIKNDSMTGYSAYIQWVVTIFMILFGVNFNAYYLLLFGHARKAFAMEEVRSYFGIILSATLVIFLTILHGCKGIFDALTKAAFQVASIITTTGYSTADFDLWDQTPKMILLGLMFIGACAGSTGGGVKVSRYMILFKTIKKELTSYIHAKNVKKINLDGKPVDHEVVRSVNVFFVTFIAIFVVSCFLLSFEEHNDILTTISSVIASLNNVGPGLSLAGPTHNYGFDVRYARRQTGALPDPAFVPSGTLEGHFSQSSDIPHKKQK